MLRSLVIVLLALAGLAPTLGAAGFAATRSISDGPVLAVENAGPADLVLIGAGFDAGLRQGMVCNITRSGRLIGSVLLVDLSPAAGTAMILDLAAGQAIQPGDTASVRLLNS